MKRIILLISCFFLFALLCSCDTKEYGTILSDSDTEYSIIDDTENKGEIVFSSFSIKFSDSFELKKATMMSFDGESKIASDVNEAAQIGASILEKCYEQWTETKTIVVDKNLQANAWIVSGQLINRYSTSGLGAVVFSIETGEVLYW